MSIATPSKAPRAVTVKSAGLALVVLAIVAAAAYAGYARTLTAGADTGISTATVTRGNVQSSVPADGRVVVGEWQLSFGATGRVTAVEVEPGDTVTAGQTLATLDDAKARAQVTQARTALASAKAKLGTLQNQPRPEDVAAKQASVDAAESALARAEEAYALLRAASLESTVSASELQSKSAAVDAARHQLEISRANLRAAQVPASAGEIAAARAAVTDAEAGLLAAETALDDYVITAPADCTVVSVGIIAGQPLATGTGQAAAIAVADVSNPRIEGQLDEADAAAVREGMPVDVIVDGLGGQTVKGRVERVSRVADIDPNELATFALEVALDEHVEALAAGMAVRMQVITDQAADVLTIPTAAVKRTDGESVVLVVDENGATTSVTVELGKTDGKVVEVVSGLSEGQKVALGTVTEATK